MNNKKYTACALVIFAALASTALYLSNSGASASSAQSGNNLQPQGKCTLLSDEPFAQYSYLISSDRLSQSAQSALSGFRLSKTALPNGDSVINFGQTGQQGQDITVKSGQRLYFVETSLSDDGPGHDSVLGDDYLVLVDSNGCVAS